MGKRKHLDKIEKLFEKSPVVSFASIERIIGKSNYSKLLISNLIKKEKIYRLAKGCYTKHNEAGLGVFCFKPAYLGMQSALSFHNIWEQETIPIIITSRNVRMGSRKIMGLNTLLRRLDRRYMFGFEYYKEGEFYIPYSDIEKTLIDMIFFKQSVSKTEMKIIRKKANIKKLNNYLKKYPIEFRREVMNELESTY